MSAPWTQEDLGWPADAHGLTANPGLEDLASLPWLRLGEVETTSGAAGFWHAIDAWTNRRHWNGGIWRLEVQRHLEDQQAGITYVLRRLYRKNPSPLQPSGESLEWALHHAESHSCTFGLVVPNAAVTADNPRALTFWPFHYPKVRCYRLGWSPPGKLSLEVVPLADTPGDYFTSTIRSNADRFAGKLLKSLRSWAQGFDEERGVSNYVKRVEYDRIFDEAVFRQTYARLKHKYSFWVESWPEKTDPQKYVFEEMAIAAYLMSLWEQMGAGKATFYDAGCGNGFLTYLLISEGYQGVGVDAHSRGIWSMYPQEVQRSLHKRSLEPEEMWRDVGEHQWILGNHSDELTPWIPVAAMRSGARFFVLPCCFWDFAGKMNFGARVHDDGQGSYRRYLDFVRVVGLRCGFGVDEEHLRLPSTRAVALLGRAPGCLGAEEAEEVQVELVREAQEGRRAPRLSALVSGRVAG